MLWLSTWQRSVKKLLIACPCVVPKRVNEEIIGRESLVISDELEATIVKWRFHCWIPALGGHAHIFAERDAMIDGLRKIDINQPVLWVTARIEERDADNAIRCYCHL